MSLETLEFLLRENRTDRVIALYTRPLKPGSVVSFTNDSASKVTVDFPHGSPFTRKEPVVLGANGSTGKRVVAADALSACWEAQVFTDSENPMATVSFCVEKTGVNGLGFCIDSSGKVRLTRKIRRSEPPKYLSFNNLLGHSVHLSISTRTQPLKIDKNAHRRIPLTLPASNSIFITVLQNSSPRRRSSPHIAEAGGTTLGDIIVEGP